MPDHFHDVFEGLQQAAAGLQQTVLGFQRLADAANAARTEQEDLRETVRRLETLILELLDRNRPQ